MESTKCSIVIFSKVENYHTVKLEEILTEGKIVGNGIVKGADWDRHEFRVDFIGNLRGLKGSLPIGFVNEKTA